MTGQLAFDLEGTHLPGGNIRLDRGPGYALCVNVRWSRVSIWRGGRYRKVRTVRVRGSLL